MTEDLFARVVALAKEFQGVEVGNSYGTPALKVKKKFMARMWEDGETLVIMCANLDEKEFFLGSEPEIFFQTPHYRNSSAVLVRLPVVTDMRLRELIEQAWRSRAPAKVIAAYDAAANAGPRPVPPLPTLSSRARGSS